MSEESDLVWEGLSGELRKMRRRRASVRMGTFAAVVLMVVFFVQHVMNTAGEAPRVAEAASVEANVMDVAELEAAQLAVLVYDGEGMRFELMDGERLAGSEMEFSLQPVVMGPTEGFW